MAAPAPLAVLTVEEAAPSEVSTPVQAAVPQEESAPAVPTDPEAAPVDPEAFTEADSPQDRRDHIMAVPIAEVTAVLSSSTTAAVVPQGPADAAADA